MVPEGVQVQINPQSETNNQENQRFFWVINKEVEVEKIPEHPYQQFIQHGEAATLECL